MNSLSFEGFHARLDGKLMYELNTANTPIVYLYRVKKQNKTGVMKNIAKLA